MLDTQAILNQLMELGGEVEATTSEIAAAIGNGVWANEATEAGWVETLIASIRELQAQRNELEAKALALLESLK